MTIILGNQPPRPGPGNNFILHTKAKNLIPCDQPREESPANLLDRDQQWARMFPELPPRSRSATYNCMGLVFASRRADIDSSMMDVLLHDDGFIQIDEASVKIGDLVVYHNELAQTLTKHIGIIYRMPLPGELGEPMVLSKWGQSGEYLHPLHRVPTGYGIPRSYWTDRKNV